MKPFIFTDANFEDEAVNSDLPVLVDLWAIWCGPCKMIGPIVEELAKEYEGRVKIGKLDVDNNQQTAVKYGVKSIPTVLLLKDGEVKDKIIGAVPKSVFVSKIEGVL